MPEQPTRAVVGIEHDRDRDAAQASKPESGRLSKALEGQVRDLDHEIDGPFWKVSDFRKETKPGGQGPPDDVKNHLVNWGLAAVGYLVAGRMFDRLIRPAAR